MEYSRLLKELRQLRKSKNIKQDEIAAYLNIDPSAVSLYENGKRSLQVDLLERWLRFFHLKYILVDMNEEEKIINPPDEEIENFQRFKDRRNEIIRNRRKRQLSYLKSTFYENKGPFHENRGFIANHRMHSIAMVEEVKLTTGQVNLQTGISADPTRATIIYYEDFVINATFEELIDFVAQPHIHASESVMEFEPFMESLRLPSFALSEQNWTSNGVVMYLDVPDIFSKQKVIVVRDAKGFTPELLVKIKENFLQYREVLNSAGRELKDHEESLILDDDILRIVRKWQINSNEPHPKFVEWTTSDIKATSYVEILTEKEHKKSGYFNDN